MHRLFLGLNLWSVLFLTAAVSLGLASSPWHTRIGLIAAVFACLTQAGAIALFIGAAKLAKEHVGRFDMPLALLDRVNEIYHKILPATGFGSVLAAATAIVGGVVDAGTWPLWPHRILAVSAYLYLIAAIPFEYRLQARMHGVISDVEKLVPPPEKLEGAPAHPQYRPDRVVFDRGGRARALLYIGISLPLPYLGYTYIAGREVSFLLIPTLVLTAVSLGAAAHQFMASRGDHTRG